MINYGPGSDVFNLGLAWLISCPLQHTHMFKISKRNKNEQSINQINYHRINKRCWFCLPLTSSEKLKIKRQSKKIGEISWIPILLFCFFSFFGGGGEIS